MKKLRLSTFFDGIFVFLLSFFVFYSLLKGGVRKISVTLILSVTISSVITFLFCYFLERYFEKKDVLLSDKKRYDEFLKYLYFSSDKEVLSLIKNYYQKSTYKAIIKSGSVFVEEKNFMVFYSFTPKKTDANTILSSYKKTPKAVNLVFIANDYEDSVFNFFKGFGRIKLYTAKDLYLELLERNLLPSLDILPKKKKVKIPLKMVFRRENSKKFFMWGAVFLLFSTVTYYRWFYLILGGIFLTISSYLRFFKNFSQTQKADLT